MPIRITDLLRKVETETERVVTETLELGCWRRTLSSCSRSGRTLMH